MSLSPYSPWIDYEPVTLFHNANPASKPLHELALGLSPYSPTTACRSSSRWIDYEPVSQSPTCQIPRL
jgi:hypothetical protein